MADSDEQETTLTEHHHNPHNRPPVTPEHVPLENSRHENEKRFAPISRFKEYFSQQFHDTLSVHRDQLNLQGDPTEKKILERSVG